MKNLKKVLALGLALVMLLGMFTVVSAAEDKKSASDLTDWDTVQHQDAVSLMVDLGIINGMPDGSFAPAGNIDRASWAKMVYYAATGSDNADAYLGAASGLNDIAGNWAESYISYLKAGKFISGDNYGNYNPSANVTVAEACKMMLTTLGYDAEDRCYQNDAAWAGNIMTDAKRNGLLDNVDKSMTALTPLTRENAAEIVLNTLNANTVISESRRDQGVKYVVSYAYGPTLGYDVFNMVKVTAIIDKVDKDGMAVVTTVSEPAGFNVAGQISKNVKASASIAGESANVYVKAEGMKFDKDTGDIITTNGAFKSVISTYAAKAAATPVKVFSNGFTLANVVDRSKDEYVAAKFATNCAYYLNGEKSDNAGVAAAADLRGTVVQFYLDDAGDISIVKAYKYTIKQLDGDPSTKTLSDGTLQVRVPGIVGAYVDADKVSGWQGLTEGDVVLYYQTNLEGATAYTMEKADKISGKVSTYSQNGTLTINGSGYRGTQQTVSFTDGINKADCEAWNNVTDEFDFYLDKGGFLCGATQLTESMDNSKVCLVIESEITEGSMGANGNLAANLLFVDGSTEIVKVSKVGVVVTDTAGKVSLVMKSVVDDDAKAFNSDKQIKASDAQEYLTDAKNGKDKNPLTKFFNYKSTSSGYELTELKATAANGMNKNWETAVTKSFGTTGTAITKESNFTQGAVSIKADSTTTFIMAKDNNDGSKSYSVVKGFKNIHEMKATLVTAIAANADPAAPNDVNSVAKYVYLDTDKFSDDAPEGYIFIIDNTWNADAELNDDGVAQIKVVDVDGTLTTMRVDSGLKTAIGDDKMGLNADTNYIRKFWLINEIDEDKVVSRLGEAKTTSSGTTYSPASLKTLETLGNDVVALKDDVDASGKAVSYTYDADTKFVYVDLSWTDGEQANNQIGVREVDMDKWALAGCGKITNPDTFFKASDVDKTKAYETVENESDRNPNGATYIEVLATVIPRLGTTVATAEYVYVVRYLW